MPSVASSARASAFTSIGSVLVSMTMRCRPARRGPFGSAMSCIATSISASDDGSEVMMMADPRPTAAQSLTGTPPARRSCCLLLAGRRNR